MGRSDYGRGGAKAKAKASEKDQEKNDSKTAASKKGDTSKVKEAPSKEKEPAKASASKDAGKAEKEPAADTGAAKLLEEAQQKFADDERDEKIRTELRDKNRQVKAAGWGQLNGARDKSIVKVQKFQNKLKLFKGESDLQSVMSDIDGVDASKYVPELPECLMEAAGATLKLKELHAASKVCSKLYSTYEEFGGFLAKALDKAYHATAPTDVNRRRFLLRMCAELCLIECLPARSTAIVDMVKELSDISLPEEQVIINFTILCSLVQKQAVSCLDVAPAKQKAYEEVLGKSWVQRQCVLSDPLRTQITQMIISAYQSAAAGLLQSAHSRLLEQEKINQKLRVDKGAVDEDNDKKHQTLKENFTKLQSNLTTLSEYLNQPLPTPQEETPEASRIGAKTEVKEVVQKEEELPPLWEDTEQQRFFEEVTDLKDIIPAVLLNTGKSTADVEDKDDKEERSKLIKKEDKDGKAGAKEEVQSTASDFDLYLIKVGHAESAKVIDDLVIEFFHEYNTKGKRMRLAQQLLGVSRTSLHMLAAHSRFIAIVAPFLKEVPSYVMSGLKTELEQLMAERNPVGIESKIKTVRYLSELCKFKICPPGVILDMFNTLCDEFKQHDAELCANVLQSCGRYLLYTPETAVRTENLLERMMRLKNVKSMPLRLEIMLEDAYYQVKPPEGKRQKQKEKEPLELFVENLIYLRMYEEEDEDRVLKFVRKLPWDGAAPGWVKRCLLELNLHANYDNIYKLASLLAGLAKHRDAFVIDVIDALFENIQLTIERNDFREMPLRVRQAKLVGELYNYRLIDSTLVFDTMFHYIGFGGPSASRAGHVTTAHKIVERCMAMRKGNLGSISEEGAGEDAANSQLPAILADPQHPLEPPWDFFRIKLVCVILDTCGHYFDRGAVKQKLDKFMHFFFRYIKSKGDVPMRVMFMVNDTLERTRPKMTIPATKAECDQIILKILQSERETLDLEGDGEPEGEQDDDAGDDSSESSSSSDDSDDDSEGSESEDDDDSDSEESDDDKEEYARGSEATQRQTAEVEEFEKEVQQLLLESYEREKHIARPLAELPAPPQKRDGAAGVVPGMFSLMSRPRGGKVAVKQIEIPEDSKLARVAQAETKQEIQEKDEIKQKTMEFFKMSATGAVAPAPPQRMGKGMGKGRKQTDYVKGEFLPQDEEQAAQELASRVRVVHVPARTRGGPAGGRGTGRGSGGAGAPGPTSGGAGSAPAPVGSSNATGGRRRSDHQRGGTPSNPQHRGSF